MWLLLAEYWAVRFVRVLGTRQQDPFFHSVWIFVNEFSKLMANIRQRGRPSEHLALISMKVRVRARGLELGLKERQECRG